MREIRTEWPRSTLVAVAFCVGLLSAQAAGARDPSPRTAQHAVGKDALRHIQARVAGIDAAHSSVTLRDASGEMVGFELSPNIEGVENLEPGDMVSITYKNAILTRLDKVASSGIRERIETEVMQPTADGQVNSTRSVEFVATVLEIDRKNRELTLRGPTQTQEFDAAPTVSLGGLKVGDTVRAEFVSAVATSIARVGPARQ